MSDFTEIENLTKAYADARSALGEAVSDLDAEMVRLKRLRLRRIRNLAEKAANAHAELQATLDESRALFTKPKTRILHGIKVGIMKEKGKLKFDTGMVVKLIKRHMPEKADALIKVTETPQKAALSGLTAADLKKLGVTVIGGGDAVVIKPADSEIDKLVDALLDKDNAAEEVREDGCA
ncbi:host-nuclease inhibitor Gam family protein [Tepidicaulis sp. LMO-SS28]|uniref:host-nuclease inhibitor Gam family protein n=1 Tax=Tepidicaulis sp. LMO-SS28 TaxID=3447455 RepID=UPI003EDE8360